MKSSEQAALWRETMAWDEEDEYPNMGGVTIILCKPETAWTIQGTDFETMTVTPSIDASGAGHWHGFIRSGEIVGGEVLTPT
jgi:hypothetical protein